MQVMDRIMRTLSSGSVLTTPSGRSTFKIEEVNARGVMIRAGVGWPIYIPAECWEGIPNFLRGRGWVIIGATHGKPPQGSLDEYLQQFTHGTSAASYVAPILEKIGLVQLNRRKTGRIILSVSTEGGTFEERRE